MENSNEKQETKVDKALIRVFLGYMRDVNGAIAIHPLEAHAVNLVFQLYAEGYSLAKIATMLEAIEVPSPNRKSKWGRQTIDNILDNHKYAGTEHYPQIILKDLFEKIQSEKAHRSNIVVSENGENTRKETRYNTRNVLSGLIFCSECKKSYRRITRIVNNEKEMVWRCSNRVEHGKQNCKNSPTLVEDDLKQKIAQELKKAGAIRKEEFYDYEVASCLKSIVVNEDGSFLLSLI